MRVSPYLDSVYVHIGVDDKILRISSLALSEWLKERSLSRHIFTNALNKELGSKNIHGRIGGGTPHAGLLTEYLIEIDLAGTAIAHLVEIEL